MDAAYELFGKLDEFTKEIRLMRIHALSGLLDSQEDIIACTIEKVRLVDANPFYALSYVWGPSTPTASVLLNGLTLSVRRNLWLFLRTLRSRFCQPRNESAIGDRTIRVWADYLCINQDDLHERSYQVSMMGDIYQAADAVYAWIGDPSDPEGGSLGSSEVIDAQPSLSRRWSRITNEAHSSDLDFHQIALSTYWTRLWIKQEVMLAKDVWFFCGQDVANWKDIRFAAKRSYGSSQRPLQRRQSSSTSTEGTDSSATVSRRAMTSLLDLRAVRSGDFDLPALVIKFRDAKCQDARDKIYALMSLTDSDTRRQILVDYKKPLFQVLLETYPQWTGERPPWSIQGFCSQISGLLPTAELDLLYQSERLRRAVTAPGVFTTFAFSEIASVCVIAAMDRARVEPRSGTGKLSPGLHGFVARVTLKAQISSQTTHRREHFVYTHATPLEGDMLARVGPRMCFFRQECAVETNGDDRKLVLLATGTEILPTSLPMVIDDRRNRHYLLHPCRWFRHQLPDALFQLSSEQSGNADRVLGLRRGPSGVDVLCNAAAMVTLLLESEVLARPISDSGGARHCDSTSDADANGDADADIPELWSPFIFGMQHKVLDLCRTCKLMRMGTYNSHWRPTDDEPRDNCDCRWSSNMKED